MEKEILKNLYFDSALSIAELVKKLPRVHLPSQK